LVAGCGGSGGSDHANRFDVNRAMSLVYRQVGVGQRPAGSPQLRHLATKLRPLLPQGRFEPFPSLGPQQGLRNIVGDLPGRPPAILIGAHYDTQYRPKGFVGANDSAAGTAAVIELSRDLARDLPADHREIRFVLFDGEEAPPGCSDRFFQYCALRGSRAYAAAHPGQVGDMILLDYIANRGVSIPRERNSTPALWERLRRAASERGTEAIFPPGTQTPIIDDHIPFLVRHIPSIDLIDWSYPYKNGTQDTVDKLDPGALDGVGETVAQLVLDLNQGGQ
jgi:Zn-dependent M28 family amino/carboxypeptidase